MGKEKKGTRRGTDHWDDTALLNAFNAAIANHKRIVQNCRGDAGIHKKAQNCSPDKGGEIAGIHKKVQNCSTDKRGEVVDSTEESSSASVDESQNSESCAQVGDNSNDASNTKMEAGETNNLMSNENDNVVDPFVERPNLNPSYSQHAQDASQGYSSTQGAEDYAQLMNIYNELEEEKQKIWLQLGQLGYWNYQDSASTGQWGACSASQKHPTGQSSSLAYCPPSYFAYCPPSYSAYGPYVCQCLVAPCSSVGTSDGKTCDATPGIGQNGKSSSEDNNTIETAIGAAERALSSLKIKSPEKSKEMTQGQLEQSASCETNLTDVCNAWYLAGLHTGKYLAEQSVAKKQHG